MLTCVAEARFPLTARGTLKSGSGLPGSGAGSLHAASFGRCTGPAGPVFTLQAGGLPWHVNLHQPVRPRRRLPAAALVSGSSPVRISGQPSPKYPASSS